MTAAATLIRSRHPKVQSSEFSHCQKNPSFGSVARAMTVAATFTKKVEFGDTKAPGRQRQLLNILFFEKDLAFGSVARDIATAAATFKH